MEKAGVVNGSVVIDGKRYYTLEEVPERLQPLALEAFKMAAPIELKAFTHPNQEKHVAIMVLLVVSYVFNIFIGSSLYSTGVGFLLTHLHLFGVHPATSYVIGFLFANLMYFVASQLFMRSKKSGLILKYGYHGSRNFEVTIIQFTLLAGVTFLMNITLFFLIFFGLLR